ncbi:LOW QUALITY PROTEIN: hypothetical protein ACHAW6_011111 [Cyclotella cf. meneghiniana]
MSLDASYKAVDDFFDADNTAPKIDLHMPSTDEEWDRMNHLFTNKSTMKLLLVVALDGIVQCTNKPSKKEAINVIAHQYGHYKSYRVNCQACLTANLEFMYFGVVSQGSPDDKISYPMAHVCYGVANAAYTLSEHILIPYTGSDRLDYSQDSFYYLSQLYICVEMAFGWLVNKF